MNNIIVENNNQNDQTDSFKSILKDIIIWVEITRANIGAIILTGVLTGALFFTKTFFENTKYIASLSFALEEERPGGMTNALGLASSLGIDLGNGSSAGLFASSNIIELMKSKLVVRKALSRKAYIENVETSLGEFYMVHVKKSSKTEGTDKKNNLFLDFSKNDRRTDSIFNTIYDEVVNNGMLSVNQKDKKVSIITIQVISENELFSKEFTESIVNEVSAFYIETKSKKARLNYQILEKQTDSIRRELGGAITGVAQGTDNTYNLNPALNIKRVGTTKRQIDVQANTAILTQLIANLEMAKVSLRKETPLIQIIDRPTFPLMKSKPSWMLNLVIGLIVGIIGSVIFFITKRKLQNLLN